MNTDHQSEPPDAARLPSRAETLTAWFTARAAATPERVAVSWNGHPVTYRELDRESDRLARRLAARGAGPEDRVGICLGRSGGLVTAILGVLKSGAGYVPLDPAYPADRLQGMLQDAGIQRVVTDAEHLAMLGSWADRALRLEEAEDCDASLPAPGPDHLAYVIYTSGSTGTPKGVEITHRNVVRLFTETEPWYHFDERDVWTLFHSFAFDFSVWEMWGALLYGGRLVVVPYETSRSPAAFLRLLREERVTVLNQTPSAFRQLIQAEETAGASGPLALRYVIFGGEALEMQSLRPWFSRHGDARPRLVNMYGITETTVHVTYRPLTAADVDRPSLIGVPIPDLRLHLLGPDLQPVPDGAIGEIVVGGPGVARGYLHRPDLTRERFLPDPFTGSGRMYRSGDLARRLPDGELEYCGRADFQVKIRGHRVELGEIESALNRHPRIHESAVWLREEVLAAYYVEREGPELTASELRVHLGRSLPEYMIPAAYVRLDRMPLNENGKLDRSALPRPGRQRPRLAQPWVPPATSLERFLEQIWRSVLRLDQVGTADPFFELGGTSLHAAEMVRQVGEALGEFIYVVSVFDHPTVARFAAFLEKDYPKAVVRLFPDLAPRLEVSESREPVSAEDLRRLGQAVPARRPVEGSPASRNPRAIFVLSTPRSGTTLFRIMLAGHPQLFAAAELLLLGFDTLQERRAAFSGKFSLWREGLIRAWMEARQCGAEEAVAWMETLERENRTTCEAYRLLQEAVHPRTLVEKTPGYSLDPECLRKAEADFENPFYIHLTRHPYAMIRSFEQFHVGQVLYLRDHPFTGRRLGEMVWTLSHSRILEFLATVPPERQHRISFESLTRDPRPEMERLCAALGLPFHPDLLQPYKAQERKMVDGLHAASTPMGDTKFRELGAIDPSIAEKWRAVEQDNFLSPLTWSVASRLGYAPPAGGRETAPASGRRQLQQQRTARHRARTATER